MKRLWELWVAFYEWFCDRHSIDIFVAMMLVVMAERLLRDGRHIQAVIFLVCGVVAFLRAREE